MTTVKKAVTAQTVLTADFTFNVGTDAMLNSAGVLTNFKAAAGIFDIMTLPPGHQVVGGEVVVETVSDETGTATIKVGDDNDDDYYSNGSTVNIKSAARTALTPTGTKHTVSRPIRVTFANQNGNATAGVVRVTVSFIVPGSRASENLKTR